MGRHVCSMGRNEEFTMFNQEQKFHVIPSVRNMKHLNKVLTLEEEWVLLSNIHIGNMKEVCDICHKAGKKVIVNHEIVGGLGIDKTAFQLLKNMFCVDAVMGSSVKKLGMIKKEGLFTIQRVALIDSLAVEQALKGISDAKCDAVELRPGLYAIEYLEAFKRRYPGRYLAGGFINTKETMDQVYRSGFDGTMTSYPDLWGYQPCTG